MIKRNMDALLRRSARSFPVVTVTGPRQSGKSTLCRKFFPRHPYINLEAPDLRRFALDDPRGFLSEYPDGAILDEIQRCPELASYLQTLVDEDRRRGRWILTGSQNLTLLESISQSLAGRTAVLNLLPLTGDEIRRFKVHPKMLDSVLLSGSYPRIYDQKIAPADWYRSYVTTYIERDIRTLLKVTDLIVFQRFLELCAGRTGQLLNLSSLAGDCGISQPTAKAWMGLLETSFLAFRLPPFFANLRKRLIKMPKLYFYDTGLVCWLLGIRSVDQLKTHPLRGAIFETWVISEIAKHRANAGQSGGMFFYRDQHGVEMDLLVEAGDHWLAVEIKSGQTLSGETLTHITQLGELFQSVKPTRLIVAYAGSALRTIRDIQMVPWDRVANQPWV
jgi:predicted AAA+ superfamily ATPase